MSQGQGTGPDSSKHLCSPIQNKRHVLLRFHFFIPQWRSTEKGDRVLSGQTLLVPTSTTLQSNFTTAECSDTEYMLPLCKHVVTGLSFRKETSKSFSSWKDPLPFLSKSSLVPSDAIWPEKTCICGN